MEKEHGGDLSLATAVVMSRDVSVVFVMSNSVVCIWYAMFSMLGSTSM